MVGIESRTDLPAEVTRLLPELKQNLKDLVKIPSVSAKPNAPLKKTAEAVAKLLREAGMPTVEVRTLKHADGKKDSAPLVYAKREGTENGPTVLLYAHYDVQPADTPWSNDRKPFEPAEEGSGDNVRLFGRGAADDKAGIVMHVGAIRAVLGLTDDLGLTVKVVVEGEEETGESALDNHIEKNPKDKDYLADVVVVADTGNVELGKPTLTSTLRGIAVVDIEIETLKTQVHSGMYGGPAPDAFMALTKVLATLHDADGNVAVPGLATHEGTWPEVKETSFRTTAGILQNVKLIGTGTIEQRLYGKPSINVVALSGPPSAESPSNVLTPKAKARVSLRLAPNQDTAAALKALKEHLKKAVPWGAKATITEVGEGRGFAAKETSAHLAVIKKALTDAYPGESVAEAGQGGSIPLVAAFAKANKEADVVLWGCEEPLANIHGIDESVSYSELEHMTLAEANLLHALATADRP